MRHSGASSPVPRRAIGTVIAIHDGGEAYTVDWCDQDERTLLVVTLRRGDLLLLREWN